MMSALAATTILAVVLIPTTVHPQTAVEPVIAQAGVSQAMPDVKPPRLANLPADLELPDYKLAPLADEIKAVPKGVVGVHVGKWNDILNFALVVEEVYSETKFKGHYVWGVAPEWKVDYGGSNTVYGEIKRNKLVFSRRGETEKHEYRIKTNGELDGEVNVYNADGTRRGGSTSKLRRIAP